MASKFATVRRPGYAGEVTDRPAWALSPEEAVLLQDAHSLPGVIAQRRGWEYDGSVADVAANLNAVYRAKFNDAAATRTLTCVDNGAVYVHNAAGAGTQVKASASDAAYMPRCMYQDTVLLVNTSSTASPQTRPVLLYAGVGSVPTLSSGTPASVANQSNITGGTWASTPPAGSFFLVGLPFTPIYDGRAGFHGRVATANSTSDFTLRNTRNTASRNLTATTIDMYATTFPCISTREDGTVTISGGNLTGIGTNFITGASGTTHGLLLPATGNVTLGLYAHASPFGAGGTAYLPDVTSVKMHTIERLNTFDVAAHRGSLWGGGNWAYRSRVYVSPPGWDMLSPPGAASPLDTSAALSNASPSYFLLDFIDVPSANDADPIVAILSSPGPLLVLKRGSVHAINGAYPSFSQNLLRDDIGCIDIRSAISLDEGQFWAGETGIFRYSSGRIEDLTDDRINTEWRRIVREGVTYCSMGVAHGHLVVSVKAATTSRTYVLNLGTGAWSRMTNVLARYLHTARISGEVEACFAVDDARQGRVLDLTPCFTGTKVTARDAQTKAAADATDDAGTGPALAYWSPSTLHSGGDPNTESRLREVTTVLNAVDSAGTSTVTVTTKHSGRVDSTGEDTVNAATVNADATDLQDRRRHFVGVAGRLHQVRVEAGTVASTLSKLELHEIGLWYRERGRHR